MGISMNAMQCIKQSGWTFETCNGRLTQKQTWTLKYKEGEQQDEDDDDRNCENRSEINLSICIIFITRFVRKVFVSWLSTF